MRIANSITKSAGVLVFLSLSCAILLATLCVGSARGQQAKFANSTSLLEPDSTPDQYKLIFPKAYKSPSYYPLKKARDGAPYLEFKRVQLNNFLNELNDAGARGYKLVSAAHEEIPVAISAISRIQGVQYEYELVITSSLVSSLLDRKDNFEELSKRGFHFAAHFEFATYCRDTNGDGDSSTADACNTVDVVVLERKKGADKPTEYSLIHPTGRWPSPLENWLADQVKQKLVNGFEPTHLIGNYGIFVEKDDQRSIDGGDIQVLPPSKYWTADHSKSRINNLAKQGYRLAMLNSRIALMYKNHETTTPVTYLWLHTTTQRNWRIEKRKRKDLEEKLAELEAAGAVYRTTYVDNQEYYKLVFEQNALSNPRRNEYKVFAFDFEFRQDVPASNVNVDLATASKEQLKLINSLAKDGFVVRDLFIAGGYNILLERTTGTER